MLKMFRFRMSLLFVVFASCCLMLSLSVRGESVIRRMMIKEVEEIVEISDRDQPDQVQYKKSFAEPSFNISQHKLIKFLSDIQAATKYFQRPLTSFSWSQCDSGSPQLAKINSLTLTPDPLNLPGTIYFSFDVELSKSIDAPLKASIELKKKIAFVWIDIPCIDNIGSCTYDDLCEKLAGAVCPQSFVDNKVPCKCPFNQGHFTIPVSGISVNVGSIPGGDYKIKLQLSYESTEVYCMDMSFSIA